MSYAYNLLLICCICVFTVLGAEISRKICSTTPNDSACQQIARNSEIACNYNFHSIDCLLNIKSNTSHLGRISGEDALLGANLLTNDVVVLAEIRGENPPPQTVVIVKTSIPNDFVNLKGKQLCHPGYTHDLSFSHFLLQELEDQIIDLNNPPCSDNFTLLERHISTISEFFGDSCRPGEWSQKQRTDEKLKKQYSSLCQLCDGGTCDVEYTSPFNDSLKCLVQKNADIAITTLHEANFFFASAGNRQNYKYLCKNGSSSSYRAPCIWSTKLYDLIVSERKSAHDMDNFLRGNLKTQINSTQTTAVDGKYKDPLTVILKLSTVEKITFLEQYSDYKSLNAYVNDRVTIPTPEKSKQCDRTLRWCTYSSSEQEKCKWLSQAAVNWAIQPVVECVQSEGNTELYCLDDIKKDRADIVVASSDYAYISLNKGLTSIAFPETDTRNLSAILVVTKANDTSIKSFENLKNKKACIPRFGGKEHVAFIDTTRRLGITQDAKCDYGELLSEFISDSCVPGVKSPLINESTYLVDQEKLCKQCRPVKPTATATYCNDDEVNKYFGNEGAVNCLRDGQGDFAVITKIDIANDTDLKVICKNNSLAPINGLNVDQGCALFVLPNSEVVAAASNKKISDIRNALYEFERWFGQNLRKSFYLFDRFNGELNLLFLDSTPGLNIDNEVDNIQEYKKLLRNVRHCNTPSGSTATTMSLSVLIITTFLLFT